MREPASEERVQDAIDTARTLLWFMACRLHIDDEPNPAEADFFTAIDFVTRILTDPAADDLVRKYAPACGARDKILAALRQARPPLRPKAGGPAKKLRDHWLADIIYLIRARGFDATRGEATRAKGVKESACAIVAMASQELKAMVEETHEQMHADLLALGFTSEQADIRIRGLRARSKGLSEVSLKRIWSKSPWAAKARSRR